MRAYELGTILNARITGNADATIVRAVNPAEASGDGDLAIAVTPEAIRLLSGSRATIALVPEGVDFSHQHLKTLIFIRRSRTTMPAITEVFCHRPDVCPGIHPTAVVAPDATIADDATIGPLVVVGAGAVVGAGSIILSQATLGAGAHVGVDCLIYPGVRIGWGCRLGDRTVLHHNASIGADGFSYVPTQPGALEASQDAGVRPTAGERNPLHKIHSLSIVEIGDDVEVGALSAIDRGTLKPTRIGSGTKIDDLVMIAHNVEIGVDCVLCGQVGIAGGVVIGDGVVFGGRAAVSDHLKIGRWSVIGGAACVGTNVPAGAVYVGVPAVPRAEAMENLTMMRRMRRHFARLTNISTKSPDHVSANP